MNTAIVISRAAGSSIPASPTVEVDVCLGRRLGPEYPPGAGRGVHEAWAETRTRSATAQGVLKE
jgi:hypothetical protein